MLWFSGEIATAIKKAIQEKKAFIVFVKDENDDSKKMEELWEDEEITETCSPERSISINIVADSVAGQQFSSIYPILSIPSTYLINNDGMPIDIIPGVQKKDEFLKRLNEAVNNITSDVSSVEKTPEMKQQDLAQTKQASNSTVPTGAVEETTKERADRLLEKARALKAEKEKEKEKEEEYKRRGVGQEISNAKRDQAERQAKRLTEEIAKQKAEEKATKERVREQIRLDRAEKNAKREAEKKAREDAINKKIEEKAAASAEKNDSNTSRLQFRLPDGSTVMNTFPADAMFTMVHTFASEQASAYPVIRMTTVFPRREFTSEHASMSLRELQLVPNASIIISPGRVNTVSSTSSLNPYNIIMLVLSPIFMLFNFVMSLFGGGNSDCNQTDTTNTNDSQLASEPYQSTQSEASRSAAARRRLGGNISGLRRDDDDENATWNGNSTQQM